jgi:hypothetical protein
VVEPEMSADERERLHSSADVFEKGAGVAPGGYEPPR